MPAKKSAKPAAKPTSTKQGAGRKGKPAPVVPEVNHGNRGVPTLAPVAEPLGAKQAKAAEAKYGVAVAVAGGEGMGTRATVRGASMCAVLRQLGYTLYPGFTVGKAKELCAVLGVPMRASTLGCQVGSGRQCAKHGSETGHHGAVPTPLTPAQVKELAKLVGL